MPKLGPVTIDTETLALLNAASDAAKISRAEALRQCIRAHAPAMIAAHSNPRLAAEIVKLFKFDRNRVAEVKEARCGHR